MESFKVAAVVAYQLFQSAGITTADMAVICKRLVAHLNAIGIEYKPVPAITFSTTTPDGIQAESVCRWFAMACFDFLIRENREIPPRFFEYLRHVVTPVCISKLRKARGGALSATDGRIDDVLEIALAIAYNATPNYQYIVAKKFAYHDGLVLINGKTYEVNVEDLADIQHGINNGCVVMTYLSAAGIPTVSRYPVHNVLRSAIALAGKHYIEMMIGKRFVFTNRKNDSGKRIRTLVEMEVNVENIPEKSREQLGDFPIDEFMGSPIDEKIKAVFLGLWKGRTKEEAIEIAEMTLGAPMSRATFYRMQDEAISSAEKFVK